MTQSWSLLPDLQALVYFVNTYNNYHLNWLFPAFQNGVKFYLNDFIELLIQW